MRDRKKTFEKIKAIAWFIIILSLFCWIAFRVMTPFKGTDNQSKKRYEAFYDLGIKGRITGVDAGRGIKIKVGSGSYIEMPGYYCTSSKTDTAFFETGQNIGDSLIKKAQSDIFLLKKSNGDTLTFKIVK